MRLRSLPMVAAGCLVLAAGCKPPASPGASGSAGAPGAAGGRRIVFVFKSAGQYAEACKKGQQQANDELKARGVSVEFLAPETAEVGKQISMIEQLIAAKAAAIVVSPNDDKAIVPIVQKAMEAGVKVYTWDADAAASKRIFYVAAADDVKIGEDIADALAKDIGGKGKVQIVSGGRGAANLNAHVAGMEKAFAKYAGITLVKPTIYNDDDDVKARSMATAAFQRDPDIAGFACANSPSPPAVGEAVTSLGKVGKVKVWGLSLPSLTNQYLKSGANSGIMLWDPAKLTYLTALLVNEDLDGKHPVDGAEYPGIGKLTVKGPAVVMPGITFTKDNVDQYKF